MPDPVNNLKASRSRTPLIGITMDVVQPDPGRLKADCSLAYAMCVERAGGTPIMLPPMASLLEEQLRLCDGFVLTGGDDPRMEPFGVRTHPQAKVIHPQRQDYEVSLLRMLRRDRCDAPVLGICLGMQLMSLEAGGAIDQYLPDSLPTYALHKNAEHHVGAEHGCQFRTGRVWSNHRQAITDAGSLRVIARSEDGVIEAVRDESRPWYLGVQWHPERTPDEALGQRILNDLVSACAR